jgi:hypothetical protein
LDGVASLLSPMFFAICPTGSRPVGIVRLLALLYYSIWPASCDHLHIYHYLRNGGVGEARLLKISIFLMVAVFAGHYQKEVILGGLAALQTSPRGRPRDS